MMNKQELKLNDERKEQLKAMVKGHLYVRIILIMISLVTFFTLIIPMICFCIALYLSSQENQLKVLIK
jgi:hypothetical protein